MKSILISLFFMSLHLTLLVAQEAAPLSLDYKEPDAALMQDFNDGFEVIVKGNLKDKFYKLYIVRCHENKAERKELCSKVPCRADSVQCLFLSKPLSKDTIQLCCKYREEVNINLPALLIPQILMETYPSKTYFDTDCLPIMAFTTGTEKKFLIDGEYHSGLSFCDVRNSKTHPSEWYEKFNIKDYIYFELELSD
ncbi:hypothetical protein [uncultured Bacteroides sp.]|uniref:hypothetical protein n=1 Tax=uncultured Bacteroides sp. TaxID=162156 RepID=UPI0023BF29A4|nr:hypothetical protein [uncultured Bacteroides sp.]MDE5711280.1 hypothetical protein [Bacteroides sp.]